MVNIHLHATKIFVNNVAANYNDVMYPAAAFSLQILASGKIIANKVKDYEPGHTLLNDVFGY